MIALDTNVLVRYFTEDDPTQFQHVEQLFKKYNQDGEIFISVVVLMELSWVLESCYDWSKEEFCDVLEGILRCSQFTIENPLAVRMAVSRARKKQDFSDALIGQIGVRKNAKTYTFDKALKNDDAFVIIS